MFYICEFIYCFLYLKYMLFLLLVNFFIMKIVELFENKNIYD